MGLDGGNSAGCETGKVLPHLHRHAPGEKVRQQRGVARACPQGRQGDDIEGEPVEQVGAEFSRIHGRRQVDIGGRHDADIGGQHLFPAEALELAIFDDAQELFLHALAGRCDLVEEERAAIGELETARAPVGRAGKGAALMAEQL